MQRAIQKMSVSVYLLFPTYTNCILQLSFLSVHMSLSLSFILLDFYLADCQYLRLMLEFCH